MAKHDETQAYWSLSTSLAELSPASKRGRKRRATLLNDAGVSLFRRTTCPQIRDAIRQAFANDGGESCMSYNSGGVNVVELIEARMFGVHSLRRPKYDLRVRVHTAEGVHLWFLRAKSS